MEIFNLLDGELADEERPEGRQLRAARVGDAIGAARIGGSIYELPEGRQTFPYHYHHGVEEWLIVIAGEPTLRTPDGERKLEPGDTVCFPAGAGGAHSVLGPGRLLMLSANRDPSISVYPDSDKLGTRPSEPSDRLNFRRADAVGYWEGET
ncbi:MAG: cupin domain-containing protein [Gaiellaceae bacterium]